MISHHSLVLVCFFLLLLRYHFAIIARVVASLSSYLNVFTVPFVFRIIAHILIY